MTSPIASPDFSALSDQDLANLLLQRSESLSTDPATPAAIRGWVGGDETPLINLVQRHGDTIARKAFEVIAAEFDYLRPHLAKIAPKRIADIGCGYAFFDLLAYREFGCDLVLIDIEQSDNRHFGFADQGAAYSSLSVARKFLVANGVPESAITTVNPAETDPLDAGQVDLAVSFLSCGFHYPADTYASYFQNGVSAGGAIILDIRGFTAKKQLSNLSKLGKAERIPSPHKSRRILISKSE